MSSFKGVSLYVFNSFMSVEKRDDVIIYFLTVVKSKFMSKSINFREA